MKCRRPRDAAPGPSFDSMRVGLREVLEATELETNRDGLEDGNSTADEFGDVVVAIAHNPDVASLLPEESNITE